MMKNKHIYILLIIPVLFFQCRTTPLKEFKSMVRKSSSIKFLNTQEFKESRELMLNTFSTDVAENDSVIILEYFPDGLGSYYCTIYESKNGLYKRFSTVTSVKNRAISIDSLKITRVEDKILPMIINGQLDEVIRRGDETTITPASSLIINVLTKKKDKIEFDIKTVVTRNFLP